MGLFMIGIQKLIGTFNHNYQGTQVMLHMAKKDNNLPCHQIGIMDANKYMFRSIENGEGYFMAR